MTNLEAIKAKLNYPLSDNSFKLALTDRGLLETTIYSVSDKRSLELAQADILMTLVSTPDVVEGGYQVSLADKKTLTAVANGIYSKYGQASPLMAVAKFVQPW